MTVRNPDPDADRSHGSLNWLAIRESLAERDAADPQTRLERGIAVAADHAADDAVRSHLETAMVHAKSLPVGAVFSEHPLPHMIEDRLREAEERTEHERIEEECRECRQIVRALEVER